MLNTDELILLENGTVLMIRVKTLKSKRWLVSPKGNMYFEYSNNQLVAT